MAMWTCLARVHTTCGRQRRASTVSEKSDMTGALFVRLWGQFNHSSKEGYLIGRKKKLEALGVIQVRRGQLENGQGSR